MDSHAVQSLKRFCYVFVPVWQHRYEQLMITATVGLCSQATVTWMPYVSIACVIIYVTGHAIGPSEYDPVGGYLHTRNYNCVLH